MSTNVSFNHGSRTILVVDDDRGFLRFIRQTLEGEGFHVGTAADGPAALSILRTKPPALVLIDVALPDMDGYEICRRLRRFSDIPVLVMGGRISSEGLVSALKLGADAYLVKPFGTEELIARVNALLRRRLFPQSAITHLAVGDLHIDFSRERVSVGGQEIALTTTEYRILSLLASDAGRVYSHHDLLTEVWGPAYAEDTHILQITIARVRRKISDGAVNSRHIVTRAGVGYFFRPAEQRRNSAVAESADASETEVQARGSHSSRSAAANSSSCSFSHRR